MATNFQKFNKLAKAIKAIADKDPEVKIRIMQQAETSSNNSWNKIQSWASQNIFQETKEKGIRFFSEKKIESLVLKKLKLSTDDNTCFDVFKIPEADLSTIQPFDLERVLMSFPQNLQVQISLEGGLDTNTGIEKIINIPSVGTGDITANIRAMYPDLFDIGFTKLKKVKAKGDFTCDYYIKVHFVDDNDDPDLTPEETDRVVLEGTQVGDLSDDEKERRLELKRLVAKKFKERRAERLKDKTKRQTRDIPLPEDEVERVEDEEMQSKLVERERTKKLKEFNKSIDKITKLYEQGLITKKQFRESFQKLNGSLEKGGEI